MEKIGRVTLPDYLLDMMRARPVERLAVIADAGRENVATAVARIAAERGLEVDVVVTTEDYRREADMPARALHSLDAADVALLFVSYDRVQFGGHSEFRKRGTARGARFGFVTHDQNHPDPGVLAAIARTTREMAELLTQATRAVVTSAAGTRLEFELGARPGRALTNELGEAGAWGALPDFFEAAVAPVEGRAAGTIVIDGTSLPTGVAHEPITAQFNDGIIGRLSGGRAADLRRYLEGAGPNGLNVAELGIGLSHLVSPAALTGTFEDKKVAGTAHVGIGDNRGLGGNSTASIHTDVQMLAVTVELDGQKVAEAGRLLLR